jgi:trimethylamine--corrinoid protein Co-methyltransferase
MFTDDELQQIHLATLEVLWRTGVHISNPEAQKVYADAGCTVDRTGNVVKIPPYVVEEAISSAPSTLLLAGRNPKNDVILDGSRVSYTTFGVGVRINDIETGAYRDTCKQDIADTALVADALAHVDVYCHAVTAGHSVPQAAVDLHEAEAFLNNTSKHCQHVDLTSGFNAQKYIDMAALIAGGKDKLRERPIVSALICPQSPLSLHDICCDIIMTFAHNGIPCNVLSMAMSGGTAPVTMAGTLVVHNSEVLAGIVLSQAAQKGAPVMYGSSTTTFDLMHATAPVGSPELGICSAGVASLAQYYKLPSFGAGT